MSGYGWAFISYFDGGYEDIGFESYSGISEDAGLPI